jgi:hypothetical protein
MRREEKRESSTKNYVARFMIYIYRLKPYTPALRGLLVVHQQAF